jgi:hypothetical protein
MTMRRNAFGFEGKPDGMTKLTGEGWLADAAAGGGEIQAFTRAADGRPNLERFPIRLS